MSRLVLTLIAMLVPGTAAAEKVLTNVEGWEVFSDGRAGAFVSWVHGQGLPADTYVNDAGGHAVPLFTVQGGGFTAIRAQGPNADPTLDFPAGQPRPPDAGTIDTARIRSGFVSNVFGFGARHPLTGSTTFTAYLQVWLLAEGTGQLVNSPTLAQARQGYAKLEGGWGSLLFGRTRALFSRGATDIDGLYAHRYGVGWPGNIDANGPTQGQVGFGVLGNEEAAGAVYGTPTLHGLKLDVALFDPSQLGGVGWTRTKWARPEAELVFERRFGRGGWGTLVLFANGAYQKVYKEGTCPLTPGPNLPCEQTAAGVGYGGRLELGRFHLGVAGHYGTGLGLNYALDISDASQDPEGNIRAFRGSYVQSQVVLGKFDLFAGWGLTQVFQTSYDKTHTVGDPRDPRSADPDPAVQATASQVFPFSVIKDQMGINAGVVYNATPALHFDVDFFRAEADWNAVNGFPGPRQVAYVANSGLTTDW
jgi:hypothetical protein